MVTTADGNHDDLDERIRRALEKQDARRAELVRDEHAGRMRERRQVVDRYHFFQDCLWPAVKHVEGRLRQKHVILEGTGTIQKTGKPMKLVLVVSDRALRGRGPRELEMEFVVAPDDRTPDRLVLTSRVKHDGRWLPVGTGSGEISTITKDIIVTAILEAWVTNTQQAA